MAGQPQPNAFIPLDLRTVEQFGFVKQAAREASREVERMEREVAKALNAGKSVDPILQKRLELTREILQKNQDILRQAAVNKPDDFFGSRADARMFKFFMASQFARALMKGEFGPEMAAHLVASRALPGVLEKMGFARVGAAFGKLGPSLQIALFTAEQIKKGFDEGKKDIKAANELGGAIAAGKFSPEMIRVLDEYQWRWWEVWKFRLFGEAGAAAKIRAEGLAAAAASATDKLINSSDFEEIARKAVLDTHRFLGLYGASQADAAKLIEAGEEVRRLAAKNGELTDQELKMMAQDVFAKAELNPVLMEKFVERILKYRKTAAAAAADAERHKELKELNKTPAETFRELEDLHLHKMWTNGKRYDMLGNMANQAMFVRD